VAEPQSENTPKEPTYEAPEHIKRIQRLLELLDQRQAELSVYGPKINSLLLKQERDREAFEKQQALDKKLFTQRQDTEREALEGFCNKTKVSLAQASIQLKAELAKAFPDLAGKSA